MISRILLAAVAAGFVAGIFVSGVQMLRVTPLIIAAEAYEVAEAPAAAPAHSHEGETAAHNHGGETAAHNHGTEAAAHVHDADAWAPEDGFERTAFTVLANVLTGAGFALLLAAAITVRGQRVNWRKGLLWGAAGYLTFSLLPALGLPPELPGMAAADLGGRQIWWLLAATATAGGLALIAFSGRAALMALGALVMIVPHVLGAPHPESFSGGGVPPEMAAQFVSASLVTAGLFWLALGGLTGYMLGRTEASA